MLVDNAVVVLENVQRWADEKGVSPFAAAKATGATRPSGCQ